MIGVLDKEGQRKIRDSWRGKGAMPHYINMVTSGIWLHQHNQWAGKGVDPEPIYNKLAEGPVTFKKKFFSWSEEETCTVSGYSVDSETGLRGQSFSGTSGYKVTREGYQEVTVRDFWSFMDQYVPFEIEK